ncbi:hypothetical protein V8D89_005293 [Ganoderma adspersum]
MDTVPSDVEMAAPDAHEAQDGSASESASSKSSSPPPSPSPAQNSPIVVDDDSHTSSTDLPPPLAAADATASSSDAAPAEGARGRKSKPSSSNVAAAPPGAKPKSTKSAAPRASPSPPPPPARQPLQTIRLDIQLGGPDDYEVNISDLAKSTGQRPATPVPDLGKHDTSDESEGEGEPEPEPEPEPAPAEGDRQQKGKRRKRRNNASEYYDTTDPFIDDSELAQDERTFFAQTKQKGFYVSSGQVALLNKPSTKKPKSKKINILAPSASVSQALSTATITLPALSNVSAPAGGTTISSNGRVKIEEGSRDVPIALSDTEDGGKLKRKLSEGQGAASSISEGGAKKRRKTVEIHPFSAELEQAVEVLKEAIAKENWEAKGKFPPGIKPLLAQVALKAVILGEYDENFFNLMPRLFPYNKFTMTKLIKRTIWRDHTNLLTDRQNALIEDLRGLADEGFVKAKEEWEKSVMQWEKRQERAKLETGGETIGHSHEGSPSASDAQATPMLPRAALDHSAPPADDGEHEDGAGGGGKGRDTHPPAKRYRLTDQMKTIIWQLVCLSNECCRIENEKNSLEGSNQIVSDQGVRKNLYQKIVAAFPDGWLSSGQISREVSVMKKKYEKESMEND